MPRQNRVTPFGTIISTPARGTLMGNRGCLHDEHGNIKRLYQSRRWIICRLHFKNRRRRIMSPGKYTELFFLDEVTALAAGHRPCAECSWPRFRDFVSKWSQANPEFAVTEKIRAGTVDAILHAERMSKSKQKITYQERLSRLPIGTFVTLEEGGQAYLVLENSLLAWHAAGYGRAVSRPAHKIVWVLTPRSIVRTLAHGYRPGIHQSAFDASKRL